MRIHDLKIDPQPFADLVSGAKTGEVRNDDRGFEVGDTVRFPGGHCCTISHIQRGYGLPDGLCVLSYAHALRAASVTDDLSKQSRSGCSDERPCIPCFSDDGACQVSAAPEQEPVVWINGESLAHAQKAFGRHWLNNESTTEDDTPLYTHADDGELERLRAELVESDLCVVRALNERDAALKQLAEVQALLETAEGLLRNGRHSGQAGWQACVEKFLTRPRSSKLSATAQPAEVKS